MRDSQIQDRRKLRFTMSNKLLRWIAFISFAGYAAAVALLAYGLYTSMINPYARRLLDWLLAGGGGLFCIALVGFVCVAACVAFGQGE